MAARHRVRAGVPGRGDGRFGFDRRRRRPATSARSTSSPATSCSSPSACVLAAVADAHRAQDRSSSTTSGCCWCASCCCCWCSCRASAAASTARGAGSTWASPTSRRSKRSSCSTSSGWPATSSATARRSPPPGRRCSSRSAWPWCWSCMLLLQPDFGSSSLMLAITAGMLVLGGVNMPRMFGPVLVGLPVLAIVAIAEPYRVQPPDLVPRSVAGPVQDRLPADQRADGGRSRRMAGRRPGRIGAEAVLPARSAYRLHHRGDRRGTRLRRRLPGDRAVRGAGRARVLAGPEVRGDAPPLRRLLRVRHRAVDRACRASSRSA